MSNDAITDGSKELSDADLDQLIAQANAKGWNATGRPDWLRKHRNQFRAAVLVVFGPEGAGLLRCIVTVILNDGSGGRFTIDMSAQSLDALKDMSDRDVVVLAHRYLATFPPLDLDDDQAATWDEGAWKRWGEEKSG